MWIKFDKLYIKSLYHSKQLPRNLVRLQGTETTPFSPRTSWASKIGPKAKITTRAALRYGDEIPAKSCQKIHFFYFLSERNVERAF